MEAVQAAYRRLLNDPQALEAFSAPMAVNEWLSRFKRYARLQSCDNDRLLAQLLACAQQPICSSSVSGQWVPGFYRAPDQTVHWCWPDGKATEAFYDQFIARSRQRRPLNLFGPTTSIDALDSLPSENPAGFIAHLSRCGSSWVSTSLAELEEVAVVSESPLLTECLLDQHWSESRRQALLPGLINCHVPGGVVGHRAVVKWNAWDLCHWSTIEALYPHVPVLLVIRHPLEILASHCRQAGRHMSGDPALAGIDPVFRSGGVSLWGFRLRVLRRLMAQMLTLARQPNVKVVDYSQLCPTAMIEVAHHFGLEVPSDAQERVVQRARYSAKEPERSFTPDGDAKRRMFSKADRIEAERALLPLYRQLLTGKKKRILPAGRHAVNTSL